MRSSSTQSQRAPQTREGQKKNVNVRLPRVLVDQIQVLFEARRATEWDPKLCVVYQELLYIGLQFFDPATGRQKQQLSLTHKNGSWAADD